MAAEQHTTDVLENLKIEDFEGPLHLLDYLLVKEELPLAAISITRICDPYLKILDSQRERLDMGLATEFLLMAAQLIQLKSRLLLPRQEEGDEELETEEESIIFRLLAFRRNKLLAEDLTARHQDYRHLLKQQALSPKLLDVDSVVEPVIFEPEEFFKALEKLRRQNTERFQETGRKFQRILKREPYSVKLKLKQMWGLLEDGNTHRFHELLIDEEDRSEKVAAFLGILELLRQNQIRARQKQPFATIRIKKEKDASGEVDLEAAARLEDEV